MFRFEQPGLAKNLGVRLLGDNRAWYRSSAAARPLNAVRKRIPSPFRACYNVHHADGGAGFLQCCVCTRVELRQAGQRSPSLFGSLERGEPKTGSDIDLAGGGHKIEMALYNWISSNQPGANCEFAHGWWESAEFLQLLSSEFESFDFGVLTSYSMETPPPSSFVIMPVVSALAPNLEIYFKESWVVEPNYTVSVKWLLPGPLVLLDMLQPVDVQNRWLLRDFPTEYLYEPFREGASAFSGSVKNKHLLYALFHILTTQATEAV